MTKALNEAFLRRRAKLRSPATGKVLSRSELAAAVTEYAVRTGRGTPVDAKTIARYENGAIHWPREARREALREVMLAETDAELGFYPPWPEKYPPRPEKWTGTGSSSEGSNAGQGQRPDPRQAADDPIAGTAGDVVVGDIVIALDPCSADGASPGPEHRPVVRARVVEPADHEARLSAGGELLTIRLEVIMPNCVGPDQIGPGAPTHV